MTNESSENPIVIREKYNTDAKNCASKLDKNMDKIVEDAANEYIKRRCHNPILKKTEKLIAELGGPLGIHRILKTRIDKIMIDKKRQRYVICIIDFYERERYHEKGYAYKTVECCIREGLCRPKKLKDATKKRYKHQIKIGPHTWICFIYANSKALLGYLKYYVLIPFRRNTKADAIVRRVYKKIGLVGDLPLLIKGPYTKLCKDPYEKQE